MIDHERCSELLAGYISGTSEPSQRHEVAEHLRSCSACSAEERALRALMAPIEPLTELEAASIRRAVLHQVSPAPTQRGPLGARLAPYLGAAALLMVVAVGIVSMNTGGSDSESADRGSTEGAGDDDAGAPAAESGPGVLQEDTSAESSLSSAPPVFFKGGRTSERELQALGRNGYIEFAANYASPKTSSEGSDTEVEDTEGAANDSDNRLAQPGELLDQMAAAAGAQGEAVQACGQRALSGLGGSALPVYGAATRLEGERVLVLGFLVDVDGSYSHYSLWIFPRESCDEPTKVIEGKIAR